MSTIGRRTLLNGLVILLAAPAIVRAASLMPVKALPIEFSSTAFGNGYWVIRQLNLLVPTTEEMLLVDMGALDLDRYLAFPTNPQLR